VSRTLVIAEIGACHDGSLDRAKALVRAAADCGADIAKGQFWSSADRLAGRRGVPNPYREIYRRYQVNPEWLPELKHECERAGIEWACTCYLPEDVATVAPFVQRFKVASFEAEDLELIASHIPFLRTRELIVSLGMNAAHPASLAIPFEVTQRIRTLHCVSAYPAPVETLNLLAIRPPAGFDGQPVYDGFSDHSDPSLTWTGALAVAVGARIIEAHLRLDDTDPENPDAPHAMTPRQFEEYCRHIRFAETCLGSGEKRLQDAEREMAQYRVKS
jgi:sialic acid synthase SpsE